jgi:arylsulfatase A-like enzyme
VPFNAPHGASNLEKDSLQAPAETLARYSGRDPQERDTKYMAMVTRMDDMIGRLLATLDELQLSERTLVLFTSDNGGSGPARNDPLQGKKSTLWEGGLRVPLIARYPGKLPAGRTCDELLTTLEFLPTFAKLGGATLPEGLTLDGYDLLPVLAGDAPSPRTKMFWQHGDGRAARVGRFKWVEGSKAHGTYDVVADPGEAHDLTAERPDLTRDLQAAWAAWRSEMDAAEPRGPFLDY